MELFPKLTIGWLNGWIPVAGFYVLFAALMRLFPQEVVRRLYDRSGWTRQARVLGRIGLPFALGGMLLILITPLKIGQPVFWVGAILYLAGGVWMVIALVNFRNTPLDQPVTAGLYRYSRHPQWVGFAAVMVGAGLLVGSGIALLLLGVRILLNHFRILDEERGCLAQYGESYQAYLDRVPRYLLF